MERMFDALVGGQQFRKMLEKRCERLNELYDVRLVEMDILNFLANAGEHDTAKDIGIDMHISKAHISKSVENLHSRGYLILREDDNDRRCIHLTVTEKALPLVHAFAEEREQFLKVILEGVTQEEMDAMHSVVRKVMENLDREYQKY